MKKNKNKYYIPLLLANDNKYIIIIISNNIVYIFQKKMIEYFCKFKL